MQNYTNSLQSRRTLGGRKLLVYVRSVVPAIFDFKPEEDWGEWYSHFLLSFEVLARHFSEAKTFARPKKTPTRQATIHTAVTTMYVCKKCEYFENRKSGVLYIISLLKNFYSFQKER